MTTDKKLVTELREAGRPALVDSMQKLDRKEKGMPRPSIGEKAMTCREAASTPGYRDG
jgi:hypothetical protein